MQDKSGSSSIQISDWGFINLNITQFLGALNDNVYKWLLVYLLISIKGSSYANTVLALSGAIFVLPFILFSAVCGKLADNYSKTNILRIAKVLEIVIMLAGVVTFIYQSEWGSYAVLFMMAAQSALFSPAKYGVLPELFASEHVPAANGWLSLFTNVAIIMGSFMAAWITDTFHHNFFYASLICVLFAIIGAISSFFIPFSNSINQKKNLRLSFWNEVFQTLKLSLRTPLLTLVIIGNALFFMIAAYCQLNVVSYAIVNMGLSGTAGGYLFPSMAIGIGIGSLLAGNYSIKPRLDFLWKAALGVGFCFCALYFTSHSKLLTFIDLFFMGICGGFFIVPTDSFIQIETPQEHRGEMIGASNVLSFIGALLGSVLIYLTGDFFCLEPKVGFFLIGILTFLLGFGLKRSLKAAF
jgi:acyl-[acyl-carrier-protein]-phospholipid O-acyltransferase/long-chain-fatty-acid--[acyl-carrier-protein] ligase